MIRGFHTRRPAGICFYRIMVSVFRLSGGRQMTTQPEPTDHVAVNGYNGFTLPEPASRPPLTLRFKAFDQPL